MIDGTQSVQNFLDAAASKTPVPGGGSVAALVGALAASMGEMVLNYSVGKKHLAAYEKDLQVGLAEFHRARQMLVQLMIEDQTAFEAMTTARKLPETDPQRSVQIAESLQDCIRVPQTIAVMGVAILELAGELALKANRHLLPDLAVCAELAMATMRCGLYNVRINLADIADLAEKQALQQNIDKLTSKATALVQKVIPAIWKATEA